MKDLKFYINKALKENFALGAMNFSSIETLQAIVNVCKKLNSPCIVSVSESAIDYLEKDFLMAIVKIAKRKHSSIFLHLDHGKSYDICKQAINLGFDSIMIDGSSLPFEENVSLTKKVVDYAHSKGVIVEGELGQIKGIEENIFSQDNFYTNPIQAKKFVEKTGVDMLAVSIGTSHGVYKYAGEQTIRFDILNEIENLLPNFPLVLHGASSVDQNLINKINKNGGNIQNAKGIPINLIKECVINHNIIKINTDTDLRLAMTAGVRNFLNTYPSEIDPRKYITKGKSEIENQIEFKIKQLFLSKDKN